MSSLRARLGPALSLVGPLTFGSTLSISDCSKLETPLSLRLAAQLDPSPPFSGVSCLSSRLPWTYYKMVSSRCHVRLHIRSYLLQLGAVPLSTHHWQCWTFCAQEVHHFHRVLASWKVHFLPQIVKDLHRVRPFWRWPLDNLGAPCHCNQLAKQVHLSFWSWTSLSESCFTIRGIAQLEV